MSVPKISIVIPVYNAERYLDRCLDSIAAQTFTDYEAIFIDDLSTDASRELIKRRQNSDARIRLIELEVNGGSGIARNVGIENARGEYLSFIDADDSISSDFLKLLYEKAAETGADVVKGSCIYDEYERIVDPRTIKAIYDRGNALYVNLIKEHWSCIYRRGFIEAHSIRYGAARVSHDVVFLLQVGYFAKSFEIAPGARYRYFRNEGSAVHTFSYDRFRASMSAVGEIVDFINENDPYSEGLTGLLSLFLMRQLPVHSYLCIQPELVDKAPEFIEELCRMIKRFKNLNRLMEINYAVRVLIEFNVKENVAPVGTVVGLKSNISWKLYAFEKLIEHINSECGDQTAAVSFLCRSLAKLEPLLIGDEQGISIEEERAFYDKLQKILLKLKDATAFIQCDKLAAKTMLEYGVNIFYRGHSDPIDGIVRQLIILKRTLDIVEEHPEASNEYIDYAKKTAGKLLDKVFLLRRYAPWSIAKLSLNLLGQIQRINALACLLD